MLVIADAVKPVAWPASWAARQRNHQSTKLAVFESANFNGISIRKNGHRPRYAHGCVLPL
jgi:hypothetical protein